MGILPKPPNAEPMVTGLYMDGLQPVRESWLTLLRCGNFIIGFFWVVGAIIRIATGAVRLYQMVKGLLQ